jgi:hypothetical protein
VTNVEEKMIAYEINTYFAGIDGDFNTITAVMTFSRGF